MKFVEHENMRYEYESELGSDFLLMDDWARLNLSEAEYEAYRVEADSPEKREFFARWAVDQKIINAKVYVDGVLQVIE